jgi:signal transduction histidine kinase
VLDALVDSVRTAMRLSYLCVEDQSGQAVVVVGAFAGRGTSFPLRYRGAEAGRITVARTSDTFTAADRRLLAGVTPLLGAVLDSMGREAELRAVRERLVTVHEEERRRLRRELHDGLGPALAAVSLGIDAARARMRRDTATADRQLAELQVELRQAVGEMRRLIDALRPAVLDQHGLVAAVRQHVIAVADGVEVSVGGQPGELSAAVESAAYRIAVEAVTNAVRHSGGRTCAVTVTRVGGVLEVGVVDDGRGRGDRPEGVGIASMRERAEELGGTLTLRDGPGCRVRAVLPLGRPG